MISKICFGLYGRFPVFGALRASIGIIERDGNFLIIHRNDGRGLCLPGGISSWRETSEDTLRREIFEETGLRVENLKFRLKYFSDADIPCNISVFEVQATGDPKDSWEGSVRWTGLDELEPCILPSQRPVLSLLRKSEASHSEGKQ